MYWIDYRDATGARRREKVGLVSDARARLQERQRQIAEGKYRPPRSASSTFRALAEFALDQKSLRLASRSYKTDLERAAVILPLIGHIQAETIATKPEILEDTLARLKRSDLSGSTINRYRALISSIFTIGVRVGRVSVNPCLRVKRYKENDSRVRFLQRDEEEKLRATLKVYYPDRIPEFELAMYTGMRRGEQYTLKWSDVTTSTKWDEDKKRDVTRVILTVRGKTGRRHIVANTSAQRALEMLKAKRTQSAYVCPSTKSDTQRDWRRWFERAVKRAEIENFHWHDLRHTFASILVMRGADLKTVQDLLGHKNITMTMKYAHLSPDHRHSVAEKIGVDIDPATV